MISERTNLEASDTEKALLVDTQETGLSVVSGPHDEGHIRDHDVDENKEQPNTREVIERCSAVTESEDSQSPVHASTDGTIRGQGQHVRGEAMVPPPAPLLTGRDLDVTDVSMEVVEGATTVRNSAVVTGEANRGLQRGTPTSKAMPEPAVVAVSTPGRVSNATKLSLSATTFNGVKRRATTNVKLRNPRLGLASVAPSTDTKLPASRQPAAPACDGGFAGVAPLPQSGDLLRAWHQNSGSLPGYDSPSVWSPQQPPMVQRHYSANATSTGGGRRKLVARQLSGTPILTADLPRRDTPDAHSLQVGVVRPPPTLSSHIPRPPQFMNLGALSHRSTVASATTTSRQSSAAQFVPLVGSPVTTEQASFLGISPGAGRVTPGSSGLRMVNNTPIPQLPLHKAANYTVGLPLWSAASSGQRGNGLPVLGQGVMRSARVVSHYRVLAQTLHGTGGVETDAALRSFQILTENFNRLGPSLACDVIYRLSRCGTRREDLPRITKKFINVTSAELPLHIDLVPAPDAVRAVQGFWDLGHKTVAKRLLTSLQTHWLEPLTEKVQRTPFNTPHKQYGDLYKRRAQAEDTLVLSCPTLSQMYIDDLRGLWRVVDTIVAEAGDEPIPEGTVEIIRHELHPLRRVIRKCLADRE
ncbi:hypothetical protein FOZ63_027878, partial [Perkinsus olseni]